MFWRSKNKLFHSITDVHPNKFFLFVSMVMPYGIKYAICTLFYCAIKFIKVKKYIGFDLKLVDSYTVRVYFKIYKITFQTALPSFEVPFPNDLPILTIKPIQFILLQMQHARWYIWSRDFCIPFAPHV